MLGFDFICFALFFEGVQKKEDRRRAAEGEAGGRHAKMHQGGSSLCGRWAPGNVRSQPSACPVSDGWEVSPVSALCYLQTGGTTKHSMCAVVTHDMALVACTHRRYRVVETKQKDK